MMRRRITSIGQKVFEFDLLDSIQLLEQSWSEVKAAASAHCFPRKVLEKNDDNINNDDGDGDE